MSHEQIEVPCNDMDALLEASARAEDGEAILIIKHVCEKPLHHAVLMDDRMSIEPLDETSGN